MIPMPPWAYIAGASLLVGFGTGWTVQGWRCDAARADALEKAAKQGHKQQDKANGAASQYESERASTLAVSRANADAIRTVYRTVEVPAACAPPDSAERLLQSSINRANASAAGQPGPTLPADPADAQPAAGPGAAGLGGDAGEPVRGLRFTPSPNG